MTIDLHLHLLYCKCTLHFALKAPPIICMSRREMDDEGLPWSSLKRKSDKYAKNGEEMMDILVDDIDRYEQLSNREELLALASALAGNGAVLEVVPTLDPIDPVDVTGISVAQTQNSVDPDNVDTSNDEGVRQDRHKVVTLEDTEHFIKDNRNKNTCTKTKSDLKMFYEWALSNGEMRMIEDIPFPELDGLLARFYLGMFEQNFI